MLSLHDCFQPIYRQGCYGNHNRYDNVVSCYHGYGIISYSTVLTVLLVTDVLTRKELWNCVLLDLTALVPLSLLSSLSLYPSSLSFPLFFLSPLSVFLLFSLSFSLSLSLSPSLSIYLSLSLFSLSVSFSISLSVCLSLSFLSLLPISSLCVSLCLYLSHTPSLSYIYISLSLFNTISPTGKQMSCVECTAGYFCPLTVSNLQIPCGRGTYSKAGAAVSSTSYIL